MNAKEAFRAVDGSTTWIFFEDQSYGYDNPMLGIVTLEGTWDVSGGVVRVTGEINYAYSNELWESNPIIQAAYRAHLAKTILE
jgi:hypothetical protein